MMQNPELLKASVSSLKDLDIEDLAEMSCLGCSDVHH